MANKNFNLQKNIEIIASDIVADIFSKRTREEIKKEYIDHIEDSIYNNVLLGMDEEEAFQCACKNIGDIEKIKFLLSETHNNKLQIFLIEKVLSKIRKIFDRKKTYLIITVVLSFILLVTVFAISQPMWAEYILIKIISLPYGIITNAEIRKRITSIIAFTIVFFVAILLIKSLVSCILYFIVKVKSYLHIFVFCLLHKCKLRIHRMPFFSLFGMNANGDITITSGEKNFTIHFIDVVLKYRREVVMVDNNQYIVSKCLPNKLKTYGPTLVDGESWFNMYATVNRGYVWNGHKLKSLPNVQFKDGNKHILIIQQKPISQTFISGNRKVQINDGDIVNGFEYRSLKSLLRLIKRV